MTGEPLRGWFDSPADAAADVGDPVAPHLEVLSSLPPEPALDELEASSEAVQAFAAENPISLAADLEARTDGLPPSFREIALVEYRRAEAAGDHDWQMAMPEERAAGVAGRIVTVAREAAQLEARGYAGPGAMQRYLADMAATYAPLPAEPVATSIVTATATSAAPEARLGSRSLSSVPTEPPPPPTIGHRTALDLACGLLAALLAHPWLHPEAVTVLYGKGGTGKGITAAWLIARLVREGHVVMIIDFEGHTREWGSRLRGVGMSDEDLARVHYRAPFGDDWTARKGSLAVIANLVRDDARALGVTYIVVDSYTPATSTGDAMGGQPAAQEFFNGAVTIGLPMLVLGHVRGDAPKFPDKPFGSVFVHNLARRTWAVEALDSPERDEAEPFAPHIVRLELRNMKHSDTPAAPAQFLTFSFYADGTIDVDAGAPAKRALADLAADVLADGPMTTKEIAAAIREDTAQSHDPEDLRTTMKRYPLRFGEDTGKRPRKWALR